MRQYLGKLQVWLQAGLRIGNVRHSFVSIVFGILVVGVYYLMRLLVPDTLDGRDEIITISFIIISVLLLFPAREWILARYLSRYDYLAFYGHDLHHLELLARHFSVEELIGKIFAEFTDWLGVERATLAILDGSRNFYHYHTYKHGNHVTEIPAFPGMEELIRFLKNREAPIEVIDETLPPEIRERLLQIQAAMVYPFIFRKGLPGFLILHSKPRHPFAERALHYFADKSAVAIQNYLLSSRVIDSQLYDDELKSARRIQKLLHQTRIPRIDCFEIEPRGSARTVIEFFKKSPDTYYLVALSADRLSSASGIILYGLLGTLHAILEREPEMRINDLLTRLRTDSDFHREEYRIDILIAEIQAASPVFTILHGGDSYSVYEGTSPGKNLLSLGWRNLLELKPERVYVFSYHSIPLISFRYICQSERVEQGTP